MKRELQTVVLLLCLPVCGQPQAKAPESKPPAKQQPSNPPDLRVHVGSVLGPSNLIHYVRPVYPAWARNKHFESNIEFTATIGKDGTLRNITLVKGPKCLVPYAEAAVRQWKYAPPKFNGVPIEVITDIILPVPSLSP